ncbi:MAG TPA: DUF1501 domain-containing protein [Planctomycetaceae bacterium]|nr:DUF1501 domain-containing protein [Planctomycetaceae bacterium]
MAGRIEQVGGRRAVFRSLAGGISAAAVMCLLDGELRGEVGHGELSVVPGRPGRATQGPTATSVIHLFMNGGPSQMDLFDPKPELTRRHGQEHFDRIAGEVEFPDAAGALLGSPFRFAQHGQSGMWVSELLPELSRHADELALLRGMYTTNLTHEPALYKYHSGSEFTGRPSLGAWITWGLGSENQNLPGYVVLEDPQGLPVNGIDNWTAGFLPASYQGTRFRATGAPVLNVSPDFQEPANVTQVERELIRRLDLRHQQQRAGQARLESRIQAWELAARMQTSATDALDLQQETAATLELYGIGREPTDSYGRRCLIARRLVERGVRFVQLFINSQIWDNHSSIGTALPAACERTDRPIAGLLTDLKQRGLLDETLVVWGGEMGRLPISQLAADRNPRSSGRDHNKNAMVAWLAGGGVRGGVVHGATDELGFTAVDGRVGVPDFHATMLHLLGLGHEDLYVERAGLKERLTGVVEPRGEGDILR